MILGRISLVYKGHPYRGFDVCKRASSSLKKDILNF
jgi:hypothetical protein